MISSDTKSSLIGWKKNWTSDTKVLNNIIFHSELTHFSSDEWYNYSYKDVIERGGCTLINQYYNMSLYSALKTVYPGIMKFLVCMYLQWKRAQLGSLEFQSSQQEILE
jgi:hypothetical protein